MPGLEGYSYDVLLASGTLECMYLRPSPSSVAVGATDCGEMALLPLSHSAQGGQSGLDGHRNPPKLEGPGPNHSRYL